MWKLIKHELARVGCFVAIALMMIVATAFTKLVLGWFKYDEASRNVLSHQIGEYVGKGLLGTAVLLGFILMGRQLMAELRARSNSPPRLPSVPPPLPTQSQPNNSRRND